MRERRMQSGQGSDPPPEEGGGSTSEPEGVDVSDATGRNSTGEGLAVEQEDHDTAAPSTHPEDKVRGEVADGGEDAMPN